jgi:hypothetical protein
MSETTGRKHTEGKEELLFGASVKCMNGKIVLFREPWGNFLEIDTGNGPVLLTKPQTDRLLEYIKEIMNA